MLSAIQTGEVSAVQQLLNAGHPINAPVHKSLPALHLAVQLGLLQIVQLLLSAGASLDRVPYCPSVMYLAVHSTASSSAEVIKLMVQAGADIRYGLGGVNSISGWFVGCVLTSVISRTALWRCVGVNYASAYSAPPCAA